MHILDTVSFGAIVAVRDRLMGMQAGGKKVYRLESGDPNFDVSPSIKEAIKTALDRGHTHYTASSGILPLRQAIVEKISRENGLGISDPEHIIVTNGGMHALYLTFGALLDPGDEVILPDPMWTEIAENIRLAGGVPVRCRMELGSPEAYTADMIRRHISPKTKAIFLNTPHNPTGHVIPQGELARIAALAEQHNLTIISDEAYEHVIFDGLQHCSIGSLPGAEGRTISLFSASKSYAMSGLRVGYICATDEKFLERVKKLLRCSTNGVNSISQWGAVAALREGGDFSRSMREEYGVRRDLIYSALAGCHSITPIKPSGSFFIWVKLGAEVDDIAYTERLIESCGVGSAPGSAFGPAGSGYVRFSFSCDRAHLVEALEVLKSSIP